MPEKSAVSGSINLTKLKTKRLIRAVDQFTTAVKALMRQQSEDKVIAHFAKSPSADLAQLLEICEQLEEYEVCHVVSSALKQQQELAA